MVLQYFDEYSILEQICNRTYPWFCLPYTASFSGWQSWSLCDSRTLCGATGVAVRLNLDRFCVITSISCALSFALAKDSGSWRYTQVPAEFGYGRGDDGRTWWGATGTL